jgi:two-component system cell cycle response regulator
MRDSLTNLLNYRTFHEFLEKECYRAKKYDKPLSLVLADIDDFKRVNDTYGHLAGDHVLTTLALLLQDSMRESDTVARYGGEEIAIILPDTTPDGALALCERLRKAIASLQIDYEGSKISITVSVGIATLASGQEPSRIDLIRRADSALYKAKDSGKNRVCLFEG